MSKAKKSRYYNDILKSATPLRFVFWKYSARPEEVLLNILETGSQLKMWKIFTAPLIFGKISKNCSYTVNTINSNRLANIMVRWSWLKSWWHIIPRPNYVNYRLDNEPTYKRDQRPLMKILVYNSDYPRTKLLIVLVLDGF